MPSSKQVRLNVIFPMIFNTRLRLTLACNIVILKYAVFEEVYVLRRKLFIIFHRFRW